MPQEPNARQSQLPTDGAPSATGNSPLEQRRLALPKPMALSPESAASVREGVMAVMCHDVGYLPVVADGVLVGILRVAELDRFEAAPAPGGSDAVGHRSRLAPGAQYRRRDQEWISGSLAPGRSPGHPG